VTALGIPHAGGGEPIADAAPSSFRFVFPTRVGVNRVCLANSIPTRRIPHAGGGEPLKGKEGLQVQLRIPHAGGGEPQNGLRVASVPFVFPTRVGVNRIVRTGPDKYRVVFPTRVGVNRLHRARDTVGVSYSPRGWG